MKCVLCMLPFLLVVGCGVNRNSDDPSTELSSQSVVLLEGDGQGVLGPLASDRAGIITLGMESRDFVTAQALNDPLPPSNPQREAWLRRQIAKGGTVILPSADFIIHSALILPSDIRLVGRPGTVIYLQADGSFGNRVPSIFNGQNQVKLNSVGLKIRDRENVRVENLTIRLSRIDGRRAEDRFVRGITVRNSRNVKILHNDLAEFSLANGVITVDSSANVEVSSNRVHDCYSNATKYRGQITGVTLDDNRVAGRASTGVVIEGNDIRHLLVGPAFQKKWGFETDGINVASPGTRNVIIKRNEIHHVGEGIDVFSSEGEITCNEVHEARLFGIKLIHGASDNYVAGNRLVSSARAEIVIAGSNVHCDGAMRNHLYRNELRGVRTVGVLFESNNGHLCPGSTGRPINNFLEENGVVLSPPVEFAVTNGYNNRFNNNRHTTPENFHRPCPAR